MQVRGEAFVPWRAARRRMPQRSGTRAKRPRSPPRHRVPNSSDREVEETDCDEEEVERRTKHRHDVRYVASPRKGKARARTPPKRKRRVVTISSEEGEPSFSPQRDDDELEQDFR